MFNTSSPLAFRNAIIGKAIDMDGVPAGQPYQCADTFKAFTKSALGYSWAFGGSGGAKELWLQRSRYAAGFDFITDINSLREGDFVVWNGSGSNPYGHVANFREYRNGGLFCVGQNQPNPYHTEVVISRANFLGALRPKKWNTPAPAPTPAPTPQPAKKTAQQIADEIWAGVGGWGNNPQRAAKIKAAGVNPDDVQAILNAKAAGSTSGSTSAPAPAPAPAAINIGDRVRTSSQIDAQTGAYLNLRVINDGESTLHSINSKGNAVLAKGRTIRAAVPLNSLTKV